MANVFVEENSLIAIGDAIRGKLGVDDKFIPGDMAAKITQIPSADPLIIEDMSNFFYKGVRMQEFDSINEKICGTAKNMYALFKECGSENISKVKKLNSKNCENMSEMFKSAVTYYGFEWKVPEMDTSKCKYMTGMFHYCQGFILPYFDTSKVIDMKYMFSDTGVTTIPQYDFSSLEDCSYMFNWCQSLKKLPVMNTHKCKYFYGMFHYATCEEIEGIDLTSCERMCDFPGNLRKLLIVPECTRVPNFSISNCNFNRENMVALLQSLPSDGSATITITGNTCVKDGTLGESDIAVAIAKGYSIVI